MFENAPLRKMTSGDLTIEGFSRAAVQSYWRVPEMKLLLDLGLQPWDFMGTPTALVTHTHLDHVAALPVYVSRRRMMKMDPPTIYLPESAIGGVQQMLHSFQRLDRGRMPCELIGVNPGDEIELSRELVVTPVATKHTVTSVGYIVWQRRRKLKPEYAELPGDKIRDIRLSGVEVTDEYRVPKLAYLGDSRPEALDDCPAFYEAETLILEMTFLAPDHRREKIHKMGHTHLDDIVARRDQFKNKTIIAGHFSVRYNDRQIKNYVEEKLPDLLDGRLQLWL